MRGESGEKARSRKLVLGASLKQLVGEDGTFRGLPSHLPDRRRRGLLFILMFAWTGCVLSMFRGRERMQVHVDEVILCV